MAQNHLADEQAPQERKLNPWELGVATALLLLGIYMVAEGFGYSVGTLRHMGPGSFPLAVGSTLVILAAGIVLETRFSTAPFPDLPIRPLLGIIAGLVSFSLLIETMGTIPAIFVLIILAMAGDPTVTWKKRIVVAGTVSVLGYLFFGLVFRLSLSPFWW